MNADLRETAAELRRKPSAEAAGWLMARYPVGSANWGAAILLIEHLSLRKKDAHDLARHYLSRLPYASDKAYRVFARLLPLQVFLSVVHDFLPLDQQRRDLLSYYLGPILHETARAPEGEQAVQSFLAMLRQEQCPQQGGGDPMSESEASPS